MQTITNESATLYHLPGKYSPGGAATRANGKPSAAVAIAPEATITYDLEGLYADRPGLRRSLEGLRVVGSGRITEKTIPVVTEVPTPAQRGVPAWAVGRSDSYVTVTTDEARELIAEMNADEIREWRALETRKGVQSMLDERAKAL